MTVEHTPRRALTDFAQYDTHTGTGSPLYCVDGPMQGALLFNSEQYFLAYLEGGAWSSKQK